MLPLRLALRQQLESTRLGRNFELPLIQQRAWNGEDETAKAVSETNVCCGWNALQGQRRGHAKEGEATSCRGEAVGAEQKVPGASSDCIADAAQ